MRMTTTILTSRTFRHCARRLAMALATHNQRRIARLEQHLARLKRKRQTASDVFKMMDELDAICETAD